ncbi:hypothetical protein DIPPA_34636 [Diplonema papillatum]|nr:hypothetical protein DIPPA_34636 [Diplonema papillatum]
MLRNNRLKLLLKQQDPKKRTVSLESRKKAAAAVPTAPATGPPATAGFARPIGHPSPTRHSGGSHPSPPRGGAGYAQRGASDAAGLPLLSLASSIPTGPNPGEPRGSRMGRAFKRFEKTLGGFIAPAPRLLSLPRHPSDGKARPASPAHAAVSLVHTTGGIQSAGDTFLFAPSPTRYDIPRPPAKGAGGCLPRERRKIESHCGDVDLFQSWNGLGPGSYFETLDDFGFCGRYRPPQHYRLPLSARK